MARMKTYASLAGAGLLTSAVVALAQTPPSDPNPNPNTPPRPRQPAPPSGQQPPPRTTPPAQRPAMGAHAGFMETPKYAQRLDTTLGANVIQLCADNQFKGDTTNLDDVIKSHATGTLNEFPADYDDSVTSLRWHLNPGVLVVLFDDAEGKGPQLALWGKGQIADLGSVDFNEKASRWSWYDVGGGAEPRSAGSMIMPHGAQALASSLAEGSIELFDDQQFEGTQQKVVGFTGQKAGDWHLLPAEDENSLSSVRWSLPEGAVVIFAAEDGGNDNLVLFGEGQYADLGHCDFDNQASRWSWAYIGAPMRDPNGMKPRDPNEVKPRDPNDMNPRDPNERPRQPGDNPRQP